jgi:hypothetical protein
VPVLLTGLGDNKISAPWLSELIAPPAVSR